MDRVLESNFHTTGELIPEDARGAGPGSKASSDRRLKFGSKALDGVRRALAWGNPFGVAANPYKEGRGKGGLAVSRVLERLREKTYVVAEASGGIDRRAFSAGFRINERKSSLTRIFRRGFVRRQFA
jgi:hypothetical protein